MSYVMKVLIDHNGNYLPAPSFLQSYDLEKAAVPSRYPTGYAQVTNDIGKAMRFADAAEVLTTWKAQSKTCPLRPDGRANRPLTSLTIEPWKLS
jgi:hypothetical protein